MYCRRISYILLSTFIVLGYAAMAQQKAWTLQQCIDTAIENNIVLKQGQLGNEVNAITLQQSKNNLYPNLNITDAHSFNFGNTGQPAGQHVTTNSFALSSSVTLFNGFQYLNTIRQNKFIYDAGVQGVEKLKNDLSLNVLAAYVQVLVAYEEVDIANEQIQSTSVQVDRAQKFVDAGKIPESNLLQVQSQLAADRLSGVTAQNQLQLAKVTLMQLMNVPVNYSFSVVRPQVHDSSLQVMPFTPDAIYKTAEAFLPEIKNAQLSINASEAGLKTAKGLYMPRLTMSGSIRTSGSNVAYEQAYQTGTIGFLQSNPADEVIGYIPTTTTTASSANLWNQLNNNINQLIGLNLTIPIFNGFTAKNEVALAKINILNSQLNQDAVKLQLRKSIEQAYTDLLAAANQYAAAQEAFKAEKRTFTDLEKKFNIGLTSATDYLIEKSNYQKAEQQVVQAKYDYLFKARLLDFYLGKPITL